MHWYRSLTRAQQRVLVGLALTVVAVIAALGWSVWTTLQATTAPPSPIAAPSQPAASPVSSPSPPPPPTPTSRPSPSPTEPFDISQAGLIAMEVAEARGSQTRWRTPVTLVNEHGMSVALYERYETWPPLPIEVRPLLEALGLWYWEDLRLDVVAHAEDAAAVYVPERGELTLRRDWDGLPAILRMQLAYGYARAHPDQSGDLLTLREDAASLDRRLALRAVADGDAMMAIWLYDGADPESERGETLEAWIANATVPVWRRKDPLLDDLSELSLSIGGAFAAARYETGGLEALDQTIQRPPRSTEQILHPERYDAGDEPIPIPPLAVDLDGGWVLTRTETIGEALMGLTLVEWSNGERSPEVVEDWGGDRLQVWENDEGGRVALWQTAWDHARAAARFYGAVREQMPRPLVRGRVRDTTAPASLPHGRWWGSSQGVVFLHREGDRVWLIWGDDADAVTAIGAALAPPAEAEIDVE